MLIKLSIKFLFTGLLLISFIHSYSQDAPTSQFYSNLVVLNPAFAGTTQKDRVNMFYRNQWLQTDAGFHSFGASYDKSFATYSSGIGVVLTNDINGAFMSPAFDAIYSYMFEAAPSLYISLGLQAGVVQKYLNTTELMFEDALTDGTTEEELKSGYNKTYPDFATGAVAFYKNIYTGVSVDHIAQPYQGTNKSSNERLNRKYTGFIGYLYYYDARLKNQQRILSPTILLQFQGFEQNINWGCSFQYDNLVGGLWVRHNLNPNFDALIFSIGYKTQRYKFAYSYDMNISKKTTIPLGAHEISFTTMFETHKKKKYKMINSPTFLE